MSLKDTGARDISSSGEAASKDTTGGRGTFGNIADGEKISTRTSEVDGVVEQRDLVATDRTTTRY